MVYKAIHFSGHALDQMRERGITRRQVKWLIARGLRSRAPSLHGDQRWEAKGYVGREEAAVIFIEFPFHYLVVTVEKIEPTARTQRRSRRQKRNKNKGRPND